MRRTLLGVVGLLCCRTTVRTGIPPVLPHVLLRARPPLPSPPEPRGRSASARVFTPPYHSDFTPWRCARLSRALLVPRHHPLLCRPFVRSRRVRENSRRSVRCVALVLLAWCGWCSWLLLWWGVVLLVWFGALGALGALGFVSFRFHVVVLSCCVRVSVVCLLVYCFACLACL